jgi:hypothetical protein
MAHEGRREDSGMNRAIHLFTSDQMRAYGEQCRAASVAPAEIESMIERLATEASACITVLGRAPEASDVRVMLDAAKLLRALSRGVPEGMVLVPREPTWNIRRALMRTDLTPDELWAAAPQFQEEWK